VAERLVPESSVIGVSVRKGGVASACEEREGNDEETLAGVFGNDGEELSESKITMDDASGFTVVVCPEG
jgi:hypothetical protein